MNDLINISGFYFINASYQLNDIYGNKLKVYVNYDKNIFKIEIVKKKDDNYFLLEKEAKKVAFDLLKRKSHINRAKRS